MPKAKLHPEKNTAARTPKPAARKIVETHNVSLKEAIQLVRSLATASPQPQRSESDRSKQSPSPRESSKTDSP
jgi:hypothetical protein